MNFVVIYHFVDYGDEIDFEFRCLMNFTKPFSDVYVWYAYDVRNDSCYILSTFRHLISAAAFVLYVHWFLGSVLRDALTGWFAVNK